MAQKAITGLQKMPNGIWKIDKKYRGERIQESTGTCDRAEAEQYLIHMLEKLRQRKVYGVRQVRTWREASIRFLMEVRNQPSIHISATYMSQLDPFIGHMPITHVDDDALAPYIRSKLEPENGKPVTNRTVNIALQRVIRVLNLCARKWRDEERRPWLDVVPMISLLDEKTNCRKPYPLSWEEQSILFAELPAHLQTMAMFKVNTGCREQEVCKLQWDWEIAVPELGTSVFLIPAGFGGRSAKSGVKNRDERLVVLNDVAKSVIEQQRGKHKLFVFPFGKPDGEGNETTVRRMNDSAWKKARIRAATKWGEKFLRKAHDGFLRVRIHDLKHTFGRRLRAAGVTEEDRKALLGHKNGSITSHYSAAELDQLIAAANKVSATDSRAPALTILKRKQA
ncbi:integrase [Pseudomonas phage psageK9]|uniref:Integrase n=3 Tax=root TaxID=1 RepID=A0A059VF45_9CAUD|nr:tyrosine-type recombinase/integrase [Pseudomonas phage phiPSA1]YP_010773221.1 integrase [Pseudomonas phage psageK9]AHZ95039.1 integrase [Pseudomonas phage phiPSA1]QXV71595.1 putative integrase [Pseudomonas phage psageB2]UAW53885.1 integrase [Pseudomonas phage psageK9]